MIRVLAFVAYLVTIVLVFLGTYGLIVQYYSAVRYSSTSLGIGTANIILLLVYGVLTFVAALLISGRYKVNRPIIQIVLCLLGALAVPLSVFVVVLKNNQVFANEPMLSLPADGILNAVWLLITYACLVVIFYLGLKAFKIR